MQRVFGLPGNLGELMQSMTHREYQTRLAWIEKRWDVPDKNDYYMMQVAQVVAQSNAKEPSRVKMDQFRIKFEKQKQKQQQRDSRDTWGMLLGLGKLTRDD